MSKEKNKSKVLAVVIPAYNEEKHIGEVVKSVPRTIAHKGKTLKTAVVVVDDCSKDATAKVAKANGAAVARHIINTGAGGATRTGLHYAMDAIDNLEYVVTIDADGQHSVEDIEKVVDYAIDNKSQMIVGSRLHEGNNESMPLHRRYGNIGLSLISRALFGIKTKDTQSGLRLFKADILPMVSDYTIDRYGFCTEMLWLAAKHNINVEEVPISVKYSEETLNNGQNNWGVIHLVLDLLWIRISR